MPPRVDLTDQRFGNLVALSFEKEGKKSFWHCLCDCGGTKLVRPDRLTRAEVKSCGCVIRPRPPAKIKHGQSRGDGGRTKTYGIWGAMKARCYNPAQIHFDRYGGRGIKVCQRWHEFENFYKDMGDPPDGLTLDRINNDGDYSLENCRWVSYKQQARNKSSSRLLTYLGETKTLAEWAETTEGLCPSTLQTRIRRGWTPERAIGTPVNVCHRRNP